MSENKIPSREAMFRNKIANETKKRNNIDENSKNIKQKKMAENIAKRCGESKGFEH